MANEKKHDSATLARIAQARHHYDTRAERRPACDFQQDFDESLYHVVGDEGRVERRPGWQTLILRQQMNGARPMSRKMSPGEIQMARLSLTEKARLS